MVAELGQEIHEVVTDGLFVLDDQDAMDLDFGFFRPGGDRVAIFCPSRGSPAHLRQRLAWANRCLAKIFRTDPELGNAVAKRIAREPKMSSGRRYIPPRRS